MGPGTWQPSGKSPQFTVARTLETQNSRPLSPQRGGRVAAGEGGLVAATASWRPESCQPRRCRPYPMHRCAPTAAPLSWHSGPNPRSCVPVRFRDIRAATSRTSRWLGVRRKVALPTLNGQDWRDLHPATGTTFSPPGVQSLSPILEAE